MKEAYDILNDPQKRKLYDKYGPHLLKLMEGEVSSPDTVMHALAHIRRRERVSLICVFAFVSAILLLFPILLAIRWNQLRALVCVFVWVYLCVCKWEYV